MSNQASFDETIFFLMQLRLSAMVPGHGAIYKRYTQGNKQMTRDRVLSCFIFLLGGEI